MIGYWNGEKAIIKAVTYEVTEAKEGKLWWQNQFIGQRRQGVEITYGNETWIIDNEHGDGHDKVTYGMGSPQFGHKSVSNPTNVVYIEDHLTKRLNKESLLAENQSHREWAKKIDPILFERSEALLKSLMSKK